MLNTAEVARLVKRAATAGTHASVLNTVPVERMATPTGSPSNGTASTRVDAGEGGRDVTDGTLSVLLCVWALGHRTVGMVHVAVHAMYGCMVM